MHHLLFRQQIKDALNQQTAIQFRQYAKQQVPDNIEQVGYISSPLFVLSRLLSSLWVSRTVSDCCALKEALYKCIDTIQSTTIP